MATATASKTKKSPKDVQAEELAQKTIEALERNQLPWDSGRPQVLPQNADGKIYEGSNFFRVLLHSLLTGESPVCLTFNGAKNKGLKIVKGSKSPFPIIAFSPILKVNGKNVSYEAYKQKYATDPKSCSSFAFYRAYRVFTLSQCEGDKSQWEGIAPPAAQNEDEIKAFIAATGAIIGHTYGITPHCKEDGSSIEMPSLGEYSDWKRYIKTVFHELIHWTGAKGRMSDNGRKSFEDYENMRNQEELTAEIGAFLLCAHFGLVTPELEENNLAYCQSWATKIKANPELVYKAAQNASKAVKFLTDKISKQ